MYPATRAITRRNSLNIVLFLSVYFNIVYVCLATTRVASVRASQALLPVPQTGCYISLRFCVVYVVHICLATTRVASVRASQALLPVPQTGCYISLRFCVVYIVHVCLATTRVATTFPFDDRVLCKM